MDQDQSIINKHSAIIFICILIAFFEGFAGLAVEIYAFRVAGMYIGSSTAITGVILAVVLTAIAIGYWLGGKVSSKINKVSLPIAASILLALSALSHATAGLFQIDMLESLSATNIANLTIAFYVGCLFAIGLMLASASVPLLTQFLAGLEDEGNDVAGKSAGLMIALTTIGSVFGSTLTPLLFLPNLGLLHSLSLFISILAFCSILCLSLVSRDFFRSVAHPLAIILICVASVVISVVFANNNMTKTGFQTSSSTWFIRDAKNIQGDRCRLFTDSATFNILSSCWNLDQYKSCQNYAQSTRLMINNIVTPNKKLAFFGGAGFSVPNEVAYADKDSEIVVLDIDKDLPKLVEEHYLEEPIQDNIEFIGTDARSFALKHLKQKKPRFDFIFIDAFTGGFPVAVNLFTLEALTNTKSISQRVAANIIIRPNKDNEYTQVLLATWRAVFKDQSRVVYLKDNNENWKDKPTNFLLCGFACEGGVPFDDVSFINSTVASIHTDNFPVLDKVYYKNF